MEQPGFFFGVNDMGKLSIEQWCEIRARKEAGESSEALGPAYGVSPQAVRKRAKKEGWIDATEDIGGLIRKKVARQVAGVVATATPEKKALALDIAAGKVVAVVERHRREWDEHREISDAAINQKNFELAKLAKITSETIKIRQDGERKAWGIEATPDPAIVPPSGGEAGRTVKVERVIIHTTKEAAAAAEANGGQ